jgi:hypothetical protein
MLRLSTITKPGQHNCVAVSYHPNDPMKRSSCADVLRVGIYWPSGEVRVSTIGLSRLQHDAVTFKNPAKRPMARSDEGGCRVQLFFNIGISALGIQLSPSRKGDTRHTFHGWISPRISGYVPYFAAGGRTHSGVAWSGLDPSALPFPGTSTTSSTSIVHGNWQTIPAHGRAKTLHIP